MHACGQAFAFAKEGYQVLGIDLTDGMIKVAINRMRSDNAVFGVADATKMPLKDGIFDVSCVSFALHEMPLKMTEEALREMVRVTRPNGMLVIVDYDLPRNKVGRYLIYNFVRLYEGKYYSRFIKSNIEATLMKSGIKVSEAHPALLRTVRILKGVKSSIN